MKHRITQALFFTIHFSLFTLLLTSCDYKELCYDHNHIANVKVIFDWTDARDADVESMTVLFYNEDAPSDAPIRYDLSRDGGMVNLQSGKWIAVAYNNDTETILLREQASPSTLEAYTRESSIEEGTQINTRIAMPRAANTEGEPVILEPDMLYGALGEPLILSPNDESATLILRPEARVTEVEITIHDVPNLEYASQFGGALTGLAPSVMMASGAVGSGCATEAFTCHVIDNTTLQMKFRIFGHCPNDILNAHLLTIYAILSDGTKWYYTTDITTKMHEASQEEETNHYIKIDLEELPIPEPIAQDSGLKPSVDGWQNIEIEVEM